MIIEIECRECGFKKTIDLNYLNTKYKNSVPLVYCKPCHQLYPKEGWRVINLEQKEKVIFT